jgi:hypothetical protein
MTSENFKNIFFCDIFLFNVQSFKTFQVYQHYEDANFSLKKVLLQRSSKVIRPLLCKNHPSTLLTDSDENLYQC